LHLQGFKTIDGRRAAEITLMDVQVPAGQLLGTEGEGVAALEACRDRAIAALCAEAIGAMSELNSATLEYAKTRKQFGVALGTFQVLQHRMVDMFIAVEQSTSITYMATLKLDEPDAERAKAVSAAKAHVGKALRFTGQNAIQLHGGMGMTDELAIGHYFKRATLLESLFGSVDHHLRRYEALSFNRAA
jgi:alkylation response protein AidB-like acyl-CoA dehydrogenase